MWPQRLNQSKTLVCAVCHDEVRRHHPKQTLCDKDSCKRINDRLTQHRRDGWSEEKIDQERQRLVQEKRPRVKLGPF
jgi:hypothetical protein